MVDDLRSKIIQENPIGKGLETFRVLFDSACKREGVVRSPGAVEQLSRESLRDLVNLLLSTLQVHPASSLLAARTGRGTLRDGLRQLQVALNSDDLDLDRIKPLPKLALADDLDDALIWDQAYLAVTESTPPPRPIASALQQTPWFSNTGGFSNSSEQRHDVDQVLKSELGPLYVGLPNFRKTYFGNVAGLEEASEAVFKKCKEGNSPLFSQGWSGWPRDANQDDVLRWFSEVNEKLLAFAEKNGPTPSHRRRLLAQPNKPIPGSTGEPKMDIGFVNAPSARRDSRCHWSEVLVPGELKSDPSSDIASKAWLDLAKYAREVLAVQDTRRFVLGFTICGSLMRIWEFDRLGGLASEQFDVNQDGLQFVSTVLGFHWMSEEQLGFDPTISTEEDGRRVVTIRRNGRPERLVIDKLMKRAPCIVGRATTCWKAYREGNPQTPLVIKDSWQCTERDEEGELLKEATERGVVNVARYYHHETVFVSNKPDDIRGNVRSGLAITEARNYRTARPMFSPITSTSTVSAPQQGRSGGAAGVKRSSSQSGACLPSSKRSCSASLTNTSSKDLSNRIHRRTIVRDFGTPIYKASSRSALLRALEGCIEGYESLYGAGLLHRDISINNLMINEDDDDDNPSWSSFLIDLDLSIRTTRDAASGAQGKTGTRAFMAIGALLGEQHSFIHDLESFFWVLFWICVHYDGPERGRVIPEFEQWNYMNMDLLASVKMGTIADEEIFMKTVETFTAYYQPFIPLINRLREVVFPGGKRYKREDKKLSFQMREILKEACNDPGI